MHHREPGGAHPVDQIAAALGPRPVGEETAGGQVGVRPYTEVGAVDVGDPGLLARLDQTGHGGHAPAGVVEMSQDPVGGHHGVGVGAEQPHPGRVVVL